ncbi:MAG: DNA polymerase III subunit beta [Candidatus Pacebacteria bacterium]|nr:DNA polymerase III subunit beta [Candidatus Paceibacterota bacterium]
MKITIEQSVLLKGIAHVQGIVEVKSTFPVLANILIQTKGSDLQLSTTDFTIDAVELIPCTTVSDKGSLTVNAHTLYGIVKKLADGTQVEIHKADDSDLVSIRAGRSVFKLPTIDSADFPEIRSEVALPNQFDLTISELKTIIDHTKFAMSTDDTRYYLNGLYIHVKDYKHENPESNEAPILRAVSTDGHRLARVELPLPEGAANIHPPGESGFIIPRKTILELRKLIDEDMGKDSLPIVKVSISNEFIRFSYGNVVITSKLVDGKFPDYERVIPTTNDKRLEVDCASFRLAVERVSTLSTELSKVVRLSLKDRTLTVNVSSSENGSGLDEIEADYNGEPMEVGFNWKYLLDVTDQIQGGIALFKLADSNGPAVISDISDQSAIYVLMPMRV